MTRHIFLLVVIFSLLALALGLFVSPSREDRPSSMPWQIETTPDGGSQVFGITLGRTTLGQAERLLGSPAEVSLFESTTGVREVEAYFDKVGLGGLSAKMVAGFDLTVAELEAMYGRGQRISTLGSGTHKITLSHDDLQQLQLCPVSSLTYLPAINLSEAQVTHRFGQPEQRVAEDAAKLVHLLYPKLGLDISISESNKEVLQYVAPRDFSRLSAPLAR